MHFEKKSHNVKKKLNYNVETGLFSKLLMKKISLAFVNAEWDLEA